MREGHGLTRLKSIYDSLLACPPSLSRLWNLIRLPPVSHLFFDASGGFTRRNMLILLCPGSPWPVFWRSIGCVGIWDDSASCHAYLSAELTSPLGIPSRIRLVGGCTTRTKTTSGWHRLLQQHGKEVLHSVSELPPCSLSLSGSCPHFHGEHISLLPHSYTANLKS